MSDGMICEDCAKTTAGRCWKHGRTWSDASGEIWRQAEAAAPTPAEPQVLDVERPAEAIAVTYGWTPSLQDTEADKIAAEYARLATSASPEAEGFPDHDCLMPSACGVTGFYCTNSRGLAWATVTPRKCRRHEWYARLQSGEYDPTDGQIEIPVVGKVCGRCGKQQDLAASRRGKLNRSRGNAIERWVCKLLGLRRAGHFGGAADAGDSSEPQGLDVERLRRHWPHENAITAENPQAFHCLCGALVNDWWAHVAAEYARLAPSAPTGEEE